MSILKEVGLSVIKPQIWQLEAAKLALNTSPKDVLSIPETAVQEFNGVSDNLQNFLLKRAFNFPQSDRVEKVQSKPPQSTAPTYPGAPLFSQGSGDADAIDFNDMKQGNFGDCYLMASLAAIASDNPQAIRDMVRENRDADGNLTSYTVTFQERDNGFLGIGGGDYEKVEVNVSPSEVLTDGANPADNGEIWVKVIEAGFAEYKGGVDNIRNGGNPSDTMEILTGNDSRTYQTDPGFFDDSYSFDSLESHLSSGEEIVISSRGDSKKLEMSGYGIHGNHAYMVERVYTDADGKQMVQLYNPWGSDHPKPIPFDQLDSYFSEIGVN